MAVASSFPLHSFWLNSAWTSDASDWSNGGKYLSNTSYIWNSSSGKQEANLWLLIRYE